ncbi:MAG: hypothetical protein FJ088_07785 [Deltaproteobacteria bacterium]|nr:hypothetical protein [Deltaproteobacteria bacterium]
MRSWKVILVICTLLLSSGCREKPRHRKKEAPVDLSGGVKVFEDDFNRSEIGENYRNFSGKWTIKDGWLHSAGDDNAGLWLSTKIPRNARVEFDARSASPEGDIKFEIFAADQSHSTGYILIMGGWSNSVSIIARKNEHGEDRNESGSVVEIGKTYRFTVVRNNGVLRWFVDGKPFMEYDDKEPLNGGFFAFNNWRSRLYFDNLKIYSL